VAGHKQQPLDLWSLLRGWFAILRFQNADVVFEVSGRCFEVYTMKRARGVDKIALMPELVQAADAS
jgi:hypothetical protein